MSGGHTSAGPPREAMLEVTVAAPEGLAAELAADALFAAGAGGIEERPALADGRAVLVAFLPEFGFISGAINNDNGVNMGCAALTWLMVRALRRQRIPTGYLLFAGEGHGFKKAENIERALDAELYFYSAQVFRTKLLF